MYIPIKDVEAKSRRESEVLDVWIRWFNVG